MTFTLRQITRSRPLRALGALAWLLLAINSLAATPLGGVGALQAHPLHAAAATLSQRGHLAAPVAAAAPMGCADRSCCNDQAGCCDGLTTHACSCPSMCGSSLLPASLTAWVPAGMGNIYAIFPTPSTLSPHAAPPLRPPVV